jgi:hypothetical protein
MPIQKLPSRHSEIRTKREMNGSERLASVIRFGRECGGDDPNSVSLAGVMKVYANPSIGKPSIGLLPQLTPQLLDRTTSGIADASPCQDSVCLGAHEAASKT